MLHALYTKHNQWANVQDDSPASKKRKRDEEIPDKEQTDGEPQKGNMDPVASPEGVNSPGVVGEEN